MNKLKILFTVAILMLLFTSCGSNLNRIRENSKDEFNKISFSLYFKEDQDTVKKLIENTRKAVDESSEEDDINRIMEEFDKSLKKIATKQEKLKEIKDLLKNNRKLQ